MLLKLLFIYLTLEIVPSYSEIYTFHHSHKLWKKELPLSDRSSDKYAHSKIASDKPVPVMESCDYDLCERSENYPEQEISHILKEGNDYKEYFGKIIEPYKAIGRIANRFKSNTASVSNLCGTRTRMVFPRSGLNIEKQKVHIVNQEDYPQIVEYELCDTGRSNKCQTDMHNIHLNTTCEQNYSIIRLLAYENENKIGLHSFAIPTGCICSYVPKYGIF